MLKKFLTTTCAIAILLSTTTTAFASQFDETQFNSIELEARNELREIQDNYPVEDSRVEPYINDPGYTGIGTTGDILIALDSITDHVGIVQDTYTVIEAHPKNPNGGVDYRSNDWKSRYSKIKGLYIPKASSTNKKNAVSYAKSQIGEPYNLFADRWGTSDWYCSKLVWRAWYEQGFDIEGRNLELRGQLVTPGDILDSPYTSVFYSSY